MLPLLITVPLCTLFALIAPDPMALFHLREASTATGSTVIPKALEPLADTVTCVASQLVAAVEL